MQFQKQNHLRRVYTVLERMNLRLWFFWGMLFLFHKGYGQYDSQFMQESKMVISILDSLTSDYHFRIIQQTRQDSMNINRYGFEPGFVPTYSPSTYEQRIREICSVVPLTYNADVQKWIDLYAVRLRDVTPKLLGLQYVYFPIIEEVFYREGIPLELKYLAVVESAFRMNATSFAGAVGLWQFILSTAKERGMRIDSYIDERRDPYKSTVHAAKYLKELYAIYNDWILAIAAYNSGPGTVNRAIRLSGGKMDFWKIKNYLPLETRSYVPAFIAVCYVFHYPAEHNLFPVWTDFTYQRDTVHVINKKISLKAIAEQTGCNVQDLYDLNPELRIGIIPYSTRPYVLRVPSRTKEYAMQNPEFFVTPDRNQEKPNIAASPTNNSTDTYSYKSPKTAAPPPNTKLTYHKVRAGETLAIIADYYSVSLQDLMAWNQLKNYNIWAGQFLKVYTRNFQQVSYQSSQNQTKPCPPNAQTMKKKYVIQAGDTLWGISQKYKGLTVERICELNNITPKTKLYKGQTIFVEEKL